MPTDPRVIWIMAGEASGDILGARLMEAIRRRSPSIAFAGIGGPRMEALGLHSLFPMRDLSVMGLVEVLPRLRFLRRRLNEAVRDIELRRPDLIVTIDSPGFALRLLRRIKNLGIPRVHYVAPQVWAWREHRVKEFPGLWDRLLCLLPFEQDYFSEFDLDGRFVGHPVLQSEADQGDADRFRRRHDIRPDAPVLILMPGSRHSEAPRLMPVFGRMLALLKRRYPTLVPVLPVSSGIADSVRAQAARWPIAPVIVTDLHDKHDAFAAAGAALTKSGTSTLELALAGVPMAVTYRVNPLTAAAVRRMIKVGHVAMVNLLAGRTIVPELLQENCRPDILAETVSKLLSDPAVANAQRGAFAEVLASLRPETGTPADAAADAVMELLPR
ncbi:lipid-A-disaccharide synthase [Tanticharoenia sakaeratensis]|uniref:Lipid-A-disaccharide synthase n=1 Tax=Tanticharoenia sakaeratensis NBRC 103193 TaxID=1231623 RepID=A0A0D6MJU7_9PROT|nr:lipid-A-disaccharide synthase [Tanticharoenia sakaeratensis]GAN53736.1 lipid-A-disaccharide synthase [Tanticharoenia sakaeratensis NBRC 103193]GBQ17060.1 lipid-A-disaccharide synthase [Tanticharoenia sakaeratensis NBRC 103193]